MPRQTPRRPRRSKPRSNTPAIIIAVLLSAVLVAAGIAYAISRPAGETPDRAVASALASWRDGGDNRGAHIATDWQLIAPTQWSHRKTDIDRGYHPARATSIWHVTSSTNRGEEIKNLWRFDLIETPQGWSITDLARH